MPSTSKLVLQQIFLKNLYRIMYKVGSNGSGEECQKLAKNELRYDLLTG